MSDDKGTYLAYVNKKFQQSTLDVINAANKIIKIYENQGLTLTLRQLYYQFVSRGLMPNSLQSYNRLGSIINDGRLAGLISWTAIEDRTRFLRGHETFESPEEAIKQVKEEYKRDLWFNQHYRPEVWIEKDALTGVIEGICDALRVNYFACRGYSSQSEQWRAGQRFARYIQNGQRPIVFHLGDHDPSGIDMTRDNQDRLSMFAGVPIQVIRLALNMEQVDQYAPPDNPAKMTDSRAAAYVEQFGDSSWELDALEPSVLRDLIRDSVLRFRDEAKWDEAIKAENEDIRVMDDIIENL